MKLAVVDASVIIVGAGVAGLAAAYELGKAGTNALVLEARPRIGGRIFTARDNTGKPIELGAEFIHGKAPDFWDLLKRARLSLKEVPERHQFCRNSKLMDDPGFWEGFERITKKIEQQKNDQPFATFLASLPDIPLEWKKFATDFVEGFDAANTDRMSIHALAKEEKYSEQIDGDHSFRITTGYDRLVEWLARELELKNIPVKCDTIVETVRWKHEGGVVIGARDAKGSRTFESERAIITLPLGVLKAGDVKFEPDVMEKRRVIEGLDMGHVVKVNLKFRSRFWPDPNFGFIHSCDEWFPTWWSHDALDLLTGWAGGPRAERMGGMEKDEIVAHAVKAVAGIFIVEERKVNDVLESAWFHDWSKDPFSRGAYSYITTGMVDAQQAFSAPVGRALYFAGEAATPEAQLGTVHGAIASGRCAAQQVLQIGSFSGGG